MTEDIPPHKHSENKSIGKSHDQETTVTKKWLENPFLASLVVPVAVILVGALIVFGLTKMLSTERSYRDLVQEMHSKTFGNRWVAAFELSKILANSRIPEEEIPWLVQNLTQVYQESADARTRNFIVLAVGSLKTTLAIPLFEQALQDPDENVRFNAVVSLGNLPVGTNFDTQKVLTLLKNPDPGLVQAALFVLAHHNIRNAEPEMVQLLSSERPSVRYAAATSLIAFQNEKAIEVLEEIFSLEESADSKVKQDANLTPGFNNADIASLKLRILDALVRYRWSALNKFLEEKVTHDSNVKISTRAQEVLNILK